MSDKRDQNYISLVSWMWMMFVTAIPIIGFIMVLVWAFTGENESRKNYFRALLAWMLLGVGLVVALALAGMLPAIERAMHDLPHGN